MGRELLFALTALLLPILPARGQSVLEGVLSRLGEEAAVFAQAAPQYLSRETLVQRAFQGKWRFPIRFGPPAARQPQGRYVSRTIVSDYTFTRLGDSGGGFEDVAAAESRGEKAEFHHQNGLRIAPRLAALYELRQPIAVDGRPVRTPAQARTLLMAGANADDRRKRQMLEQFRNLGLSEAATDFGQLILLFLKQRQSDYEFSLSGPLERGGEQLLVIAYRQIAGAGGLTVFAGRETSRFVVEGDIWVRRADYLPRRITLSAATRGKQQAVRHEAAVDYTLTSQSVLFPVAVLHRHFENALLVVENRFHYEGFLRFAAESEIRFTPEPETPGPPPK